VYRYVHPDEFGEFHDLALEMGFRWVESNPLVRSSYHAEGSDGAGCARATVINFDFVTFYNLRNLS